MKSVELIASGYEWLCPDCDMKNREIEGTATVICSGCKKEFLVSGYNHAMK